MAAGQQRKPHSKSRSLALNVVVSAATFVLLFALAEVATRIFIPVSNLGTVVEFDPELGWRLAPGASKHTVDHDRGLDYHIRINSAGMREHELEPPRPGRRRLLFLGDSVGFGSGVEARWRFSDRVERALDENVEVLNASVPGWGTDQELLYLERVGEELQPDIVVLTFYMPNDVLNNSLDHLYLGTAPKPRFTLDGDSLALAPMPPRPRVEPRLRLRNVLRRSEFLVLVKRRLDTLARSEAAKGHSLPQGFHGPGYGSDSHWTVFQNEYDAELEEAWQTTEAILRRMDRRCHALGAEFAIFAFPSVEADDDWRAWLLDASGMDPSHLDFQQPFDRLARFCRENGIDFIYPVDRFREASQTRSLFLEKDGHPNANGHMVAALAMLDWLHESYRMHYTMDNR